MGMRRSLGEGRGRLWTSILLMVLGVGLIVSGIFPTDPGAEFPPGAPEGAPEQVSWHGMLHTVGFLLANLGWLTATLVLLFRFVSLKDWGWVAGAALAVVGVLGLIGQPLSDDFALRGLAATGVSFAFTTAVALKYRTTQN